MTPPSEPGSKANARTIFASLAILIVVILSAWGIGTVGLPGVAGVTGAPHAALKPAVASAAHVNPLGVNGPYISYFDVYPTAAPQGTNFTFSTYAYGGVPPYSYKYTGFPTGCSTLNTSSYYCTPTVNGTFTIELNVTDSSANYTTANATFTVWPFAVSPFLQVSQSPEAVNHANQPCSVVNASPFFTAYCQDVQNSPNVLAFHNGSVGIVSAVTTDTTNNTCPGANVTTTSRLQEALSTTSGVTFTAIHTLGGTRCGTQNAIEPSFAVSSSGVAYGVFVMENSSAAPGQYSTRTSDAIGFVSSADNGQNWSAVQTLVTGSNLARPVVAATGSTIYVAYEDIANSSTPIPGGVLPISVHFLASTNGGAGWSTPTGLPGWNATQGYNAMSPAIAVNGSGKLTVVYATNRSCANPKAGGGCLTWGDSIVAYSSTNNGTSWSGPSWVVTGSSRVGETTCPLGFCESAFYQSTPDLSAAYDAAGDLYVAYAGTMSQSVVVGTAHNYRQSGVAVALLGHAATAWTTEPLAAPVYGRNLNASNPSVATSTQGVFVSYSEENGTTGRVNLAESYSQWIVQMPAGSKLPAVVVPRPVDMTSMPLGLTVNSTQESFVGYSSSIGINETGGGPMVAYSLPAPTVQSVVSSASYYYDNYTYNANINFAEDTWVGSPLSGAVTLQAQGYSPGIQWGVALAGLSWNLTVSGLSILDVPLGVHMLFALSSSGGSTPGVVDLAAPTASIGSPVLFPFAETVDVSFNLAFLLQLSFNPVYSMDNYQYWFGYAYPNYSTCGSSCQTVYYLLSYTYEYTGCAGSGKASIYAYNYTYEDSSMGYWDGQYYGCPYGTGMNHFSYSSAYYAGLRTASPPIPWNLYVPAGNSVYLYVYDYAAVSYISGRGSGSYTSTVSGCNYCEEYVSITMNGPINETAWTSAGGSSSALATYNESVTPHGLPAGTAYHFTWNGTVYNGTSPTAVPIYNQYAGGYVVSHVWANGSSPGWEYFGSVNPAGDVIVPYQPNVNLSFTAYEDLSQPVQNLSFHAQGLASGTLWDLRFNGTSYATTTDWVNVSVHPGTYLAYTSVGASSNGTTSYRAGSFGPTVTIAAKEYEVNISFTPTYRVLVSAATGGEVQVTGAATWNQSVTEWAAPGSVLSFSANATPGWSFLGWTGTGDGSYTGNLTNAVVTARSVIEETASFAPLPDARFNLTFVEGGLPSGTWWTINLGGKAYSTDQTTMTVGNLYAWVSGNVGRYALGIPDVYSNSTNQTRYVLLSAPGLVGTNGTLTPPVTVLYQTEELVSVTSSAGGTALIDVVGVASGDTIWGTPGVSYQLSEVAAPRYTFTRWVGTGPGSYSGTGATPTVNVSASGPITEYAEFTAIPPPPIAYYELNVSLASALSNGTVWSIELKAAGGTATGYSTTGAYLIVSGLTAGTYALTANPAVSADGLTRYTPSSTNVASVKIVGNGATATLSYTASYWVAITSSPGGTVQPGSGWQAAGSPLSLLEVADTGYTFRGWIGTGAGSYTGTSPTPELTVNGPITEIAQFLPPAPKTVTPTTTSTSSVWQSTLTIALLALVGLIVGVVIGLLIFRRGRNGGGGSGATTSSTASGTATSEAGGQGAEGVSGPGASPAYSEENEPMPPAGGGNP